MLKEFELSYSLDENRDFWNYDTFNNFGYLVTVILLMIDSYYNFVNEDFRDELLTSIMNLKTNDLPFILSDYDSFAISCKGL